MTKRTQIHLIVTIVAAGLLLVAAGCFLLVVELWEYNRSLDDHPPPPRPAMRGQVSHRQFRLTTINNPIQRNNSALF